MKFALIGRSMISPFGFAIRPRMPASWRICLNEPRAPELAIMKIGFSSIERLLHRVGDHVGPLRPDVDDALVPLLLRDQAALVLGLDLGDALLVVARICSFSSGMTMSFFEIVTPASVAKRKPSVLIASSTAASVCAP